MNSQIGTVLESNSNFINILLSGQDTFEKNKSHLQIGNFLKIASGNNYFVIARVLSIKAMNRRTGDQAEELEFILEAQPLGSIDEQVKFHKGSIELPVPTEPVFLADSALLERIFSKDGAYSFELGYLLQNSKIKIFADGNRLFSKHLALLGTTGAGKSCSVSRILQGVVGINKSRNLNKEGQKNSHIIIFDLHSEYKSAFEIEGQENFNLNLLDVSTLSLPYWMMNAEELEDMFIESGEGNSHNQVSQFRFAVRENKKKHNPSAAISYDTPVYFNLEEVCNFIENMNEEMIYKGSEGEGQGFPKLADGTVVTNRLDHYFDKVCDFVAGSTAAKEKATSGPFNGEFNRFILRLRTKLADERLNFLLYPKKKDGSAFGTDDFEIIIKQFVGYLNKSNVTIIDLSGIPFETLSLSVSLISRVLFDFSFQYSKLMHSQKKTSDVPILLVCEEAHNYVPNSDSSQYRSSRKSIERIAKEGRKYGISLMVVSQRPSEVSETILAQCNNFISLRLSNSNDQSFVKRLMPDNSSAIGDILPKLGDGEFVIVGDSVVMPAVGKFELPSPEPNSQSVKYYDEWTKPWVDAQFDEVVKKLSGN